MPLLTLFNKQQLIQVEKLSLIGKRLDFYIKNQGKSMRKFAEECGTNHVQIHNIIKGKPFGVDKLLDIIEKSNISYEWLLFGKGEMVIINTNENKNTDLIKQIEDLKNQNEQLLNIIGNLTKNK